MRDGAFYFCKPAPDFLDAFFFFYVFLQVFHKGDFFALMTANWIVAFATLRAYRQYPDRLFRASYFLQIHNVFTALNMFMRGFLNI